MILNAPSTLAIQNKLIITNIIPSIDAFPEPYLSDNAPNNGDPIPIINTFKAEAKEKSSLPVFKYSDTGTRYKPKECLSPNEINNNALPPIITKRGIKFLFEDVI